MELFWSDNIDGTLVQLDQDESAHCVRVLRHRSGDTISVIDGRGNLYTCRLVDDNPKAASAQIEDVQHDFGSHPYKLTMAVCPTKNADRLEWFVEKATEIGIDRIVPIIGDHSERKVLNTNRIKRLVLSASKQSLKGMVPVVEEPMDAMSFIAQTSSDAVKLICYCFEDESSGRRVSISEALGARIGSEPGEIVVMIGPEGDFSNREAEEAIAHGFVPVHLGESRLRTETAALVATTAIYLHNIGK